MATEQLLKTFRVKNLSVYPYEEVLDVSVVREDERIDLSSDHHEAANRIYLSHPECYIEWALMTTDFFYGHLEHTATSPHELEDATNDDIWLHVEYSLLTSQQRQDNNRLNKLRSMLRAEGIAALDIPKDIRIDEFAIGSGNGANPLKDKQIDGRFEKTRVNQLHISDHSAPNGLPIINEHSIPQEFADKFEFVWASVIQFEKISAIPTHRELLSKLEQHVRWFEKLVPSSKNEFLVRKRQPSSIG